VIGFAEPAVDLVPVGHLEQRLDRPHRVVDTGVYVAQ